MDRRTFLKYSLTAGGVLIANQALAIPGRHRAIGGGSGITGNINTSWSNWDEITESGWGDSSNVYIALMENPVLDGAETGQGLGLSGADLVLTSDNMAGAVGGGRWNGYSNSTTVTEGFLDALYSGVNQFTLIWKINGWTEKTSVQYFCGLNDFDSAQAPSAFINSATGHFYPEYMGYAPSIPWFSRSGYVWIAMWKAPTGNVFFGYKNGGTRPIKTSDFTVTQDMNRSTMPNIIGNWSRKVIIGPPGATTTIMLNTNYILAAKKCLFT